MIIRQSTLIDQRELFALAQTFPSSEELNLEIFTLTLSEKVEDPASYIGVAEKDNVIVGYASGSLHSTIYANGPTFWLDEILVAENFRKLGIGNMLMNDITAWSVERKCKLISLATNGASEFYKAIGFTDSARYFKKYI